MINKKQITETLYLSCVENYYLAWLQEYYDVTKLYGNEFITLKQVFYDFKFGAKYESYYSVSRLQDIAEQYGITTHNYYFCDANEAIKIIQSQDNHSLCLIKVNENFFATFKRSAWREDHYICIDSKLEWMNQYPLSNGRFTFKEFGDCYAGSLCIYHLGDLSVCIEDNVTRQLMTQDFDINDIPISLGSLHSAVGILRITRKRLENYYRHNRKIQSYFQSLIDYLDNLYFQIKMLELKGLDIKSNKELVLPIINYERQISKELSYEKRNYK